MQNKHLIILLIILIVASVIFYFFTGATVEAPSTSEVTDTTQTTKDYVGLTPADAEVLAQNNKVPFRVVEIDGELQPTTRDYRPGRINAVVEADVVTSYTVEGADSGVEDSTDSEPTNTDAIIGMSVTQAEAYAAANGVDFRVGTVDGEAMPVTMDYRVGRITAEVASGTVIDYTVEQ